MSDKMRSEFLEWHNGQVNMLIASGDPNAAREAQRLEPIYWCAWQASRQAVVVDLPDDGIEDCRKEIGGRCRDTFDCGYNYSSLQHERAIEAAGLRCEVKP